MLSEIHLLGIGGIVKEDLQLKGRFIAVTGESGSGKSSIIRGLEWLIDGRGGADLINSLSGHADVEVLFDSIPANIRERLLDELGIDEDFLTIKRSIKRGESRTRCFLHGRLLPASILGSVSTAMLDIQGQFAQTTLLDPSAYLSILDRAGGEELLARKQQLSMTYKKAVAIQREIAESRKALSSFKIQIPFIESCLAEIEALELASSDPEEWHSERESLDGLFGRSIVIAKLRALMYDRDDGSAGMMESAHKAASLLRNVLPPADKGESVSDKFLSAMENFTRAVDALDCGHPDEIRGRIDNLDERIGVYLALQRKLNCLNKAEIMQWKAAQETKIAGTEKEQSAIDSKEVELRKLRSALTPLAVELSSMRESAADDLMRKMRKELDEMGLERASFIINIERGKILRENGLDEVSFFYDAGSGKAIPLQKGASGGELSRILLALKCVLPKDLAAPTMIFDEIEAGLGGESAILAGNRLRRLSREFQVIIITHEASIAACADQHFVVRRCGDDAVIREVEAEERVLEIARMLSGSEGSEAALEHARVLLKWRSEII